MSIHMYREDEEIRRRVQEWKEAQWRRAHAYHMTPYRRAIRWICRHEFAVGLIAAELVMLGALYFGIFR